MSSPFSRAGEFVRAHADALLRRFSDAEAHAESAFVPTRFVWVRGLALSCDHFGGREFVRAPRGGAPALRFPDGAYDGVRDGDLVWVRASALVQFLDEALPHLKARFGLLTGDHVTSIPSGFGRAHQLLDDPRVLCWFAQNLDGPPHPKLRHLPLGVDFHTIANGRKWGHARATPGEQEAELAELRRSMRPLAERRLRVHADFHFNPRARAGDDRTLAERALRQSGIADFAPRKLPRLQLWREKTDYAFVASPRGVGLDCHRTWESLLLGNIVLVRRSSLDPLYAGLPVVAIDDWRELTPARLQEWLALHAASWGSAEIEQRLTNRYWIERARTHVAERLRAS